MKHTSKRILLTGVITAVPVFLIISGATANALELPFLNFERFISKQGLTLEEQGLNEYVDPTQFPKYYQNYNEIHFHADGVSPEEFQEFTDLLELDQVSGEKPKAQFKVSEEETLTVEVTDNLHELREKFNQKKSERNQQKALTESISFESTPITSVSFNSDPTDKRVAELNYYRGKDDALEALKKTHQDIEEAIQAEDYSQYLDEITKYQLGLQDTVEGVKQEGEIPQESRAKANDKVEKLKKSLKEQEKELDQKITEREQSILTGKPEWQQKGLRNVNAVNLVKQKVSFAQSTPNKDVMDMIYPSQEAIEKLNSEILEEREMIEKVGSSERNIFSGFNILNKAFAGYQSNFVATLRVYSRSNFDMSFDVDDGISANGRQVKLWGTSNHPAQKWEFEDDTGHITFTNNGVKKYLEVEWDGQYSSGDKIQLWSYRNKGRQRWIAYPDGTIRPRHSQNYCLDASAGVNYGSRIHLWECHGGSNQKFQIGEDDFNYLYADKQHFSYMMRIHAKEKDIVDAILGAPGHALISMPKKDRGNGAMHLTNTFGFWSAAYMDGDDNSGWAHNAYRTNNMKTDWHINVDGGNNLSDWGVANTNFQMSDSQNNQSGNLYVRRTTYMTKQKFEELKYMRGFESIGTTDPITGIYRSYKTNSYETCYHNCASYASELYYAYTNYYYNPWWGWGIGCATPGVLYNAIK